MAAAEAALPSTLFITHLPINASLPFLGSDHGRKIV
jgi:hypothetical protein